MINYEDIKKFWEEKGINENCEPKFKNLIDMNDDLVPFIGAGISYNIYPLWKKFLEQISEELISSEIDEFNKIINDKKYEKAASYLENKLGEINFSDKVKNIFNTSKINNIKGIPERHKLILKLFKHNIITTNIDKVIEEMCRRELDREIPIFIPKISADRTNKSITENDFCLIKIHGDVDENTSWVLTEKQYEEHYSQNSLFVSTLKRIMIKYSLLFLGCSLEKDNTLEILKEIIKNNNYYKHYAFLEYPTNEDNRKKRERYLINELNIYPIWYPIEQYDSIEALLTELYLKKKKNINLN